MRREQTKQTFKLHMLALVLALLLLWYSINPAPGPVSRSKSDGEPNDEKRRELEPQLQRGDSLPLPVAIKSPESAGMEARALNDDEDDFEWPEFIDA